MAKKKILVAAQHFGSANSVAPVIAEARSCGYEVIPLASNQAEIVFGERWKFGHKTLEDYGFSNKLEEITSGVLEEILDEESPDAVLVGSSTEREHNGVEKSAILAATKKGLPVTHLIDLWGGNALRFRNFEGEGLVTPTKIALIDEGHKQMMRTIGFSEEMLRVTGNPYFDHVKEAVNEVTLNDKQKTLKAAGAENTTFPFLYLGNGLKNQRGPEAYWDLDNLEIIYNVLQDTDGRVAKAIISLHNAHKPEDKEEIRKFVKSTKGRLEMYGGRLRPLDIAIAVPLTATSHSTTGIEATIAGNYCVCMQPRWDGEGLITNERGITYRVKSPEDFKNAFEALKTNNAKETEKYFPNRDSFEKSLDGKATKRVLDLTLS